MRTVLIADLAADLSLLCAAQVSLGPLSIRRLLAGWFFLFLGTAAASLPLMPRSARTACVVLAWLAAAASVSPRRQITGILESAFCVLITAFAAAGAAMLGGSALPWAPLGSAAAACMLRVRRHIRSQWNIEVVLKTRGAENTFRALIDTGNRLRDNRTGLPVLIVERDAVADVLNRIPPEQTHTLPYSVLGSAGEIACFAPEQLFFRFPGETDRKAPACRIAVFPGRIPGSTQALAPPEFLTAASTTAQTSESKRRS